MPHPLVEQYEKAIFELPDAWRVRKDLEEEVAKALTSGKHVAIRGFWRIGKTELMKGALRAACAKTGGAAFFIDLRDGDAKTPEGVRAQLKTYVEKFLKKVAPNEPVKVEASRPWDALGELEAAIFVGVDELIAVKGQNPAQLAATFSSLFSAPKNVRLVCVAHRHQAMDGAFNDLLLARPGVATVNVPVLTDDEALFLVNAPAEGQAAKFSAEAADAIATVSGHRPWELFTLCLLAARRLPDDFKGEIGMDQVTPLFNLDEWTASEDGQAVVENYLRVLATAMNPDERKVIDLLGGVGEGEADPNAVALLEEAGWIANGGEGYALRGSLFDAIAQGVATGEIRVKVEG